MIDCSPATDAPVRLERTGTVLYSFRTGNGRSQPVGFGKVSRTESSWRNNGQSFGGRTFLIYGALPLVSSLRLPRAHWTQAHKSQLNASDESDHSHSVIDDITILFTDSEHEISLLISSIFATRLFQFSSFGGRHGGNKTQQQTPYRNTSNSV